MSSIYLYNNIDICTTNYIIIRVISPIFPPPPPPSFQANTKFNSQIQSQRLGKLAIRLFILYETLPNCDLESVLNCKEIAFTDGLHRLIFRHHRGITHINIC